MEKAEVKHPVYGAETLDLRFVPVGTPSPLETAEMSDQGIEALILEQSPLYYVPCPNCENNTHEGNRGYFLWTIDQPDRIICQYCGMVFPNEKYPMDKTFSLTDPTGKTQIYKYYQSPDGKVCFLDAVVRNLAYSYLRNQATLLSKVYYSTRRALYAHKAAVIIKRFGEVYPHLCVTSFEYSTDKSQGGLAPKGSNNFFHSKPPYPEGSSRLSQTRHGRYDEIPIDLIMAYDLIYNSGELEKLGDNVKDDIEKNLFYPSVEYVRSFLDKSLTNMTGRTIMGLIAAGRVLGEPRWVHEAIHLFRRITREKFFSDGMWGQGTISYHNFITNSLQWAVDACKGYSDPPGYVDRLTGEHFKDWDLSQEEKAFFAKAQNAVKAYRYPNGLATSVHDTHPNTPIQGEYESAAIINTPSRLLPDTGHCVLAYGRGERQLQAHLHFCTVQDGHHHFDALNLSLFAKGRVLLPDLGYTFTVHRPWATCTLAHNTVVVDGHNQKLSRMKTFSHLGLYEVSHPEIQLAEAFSKDVYPYLDVYRRFVAVVGISKEDAYLFDVFRIAGGKVHEWVIHGPADADAKVETTPKAQHVRGSLWDHLLNREEPGNRLYTPYQQIRNISKFATSDAWSLKFIYAQEEGSPKLSITLLGATETEVVVGEAPSVQRAYRQNALVDKILMPIVVARRKVEGSRSVFTAICQPYLDKPFVQKLERLKVKGDDEWASAVKIFMGGMTDYIVNSMPSPDYKACEVEEEDLAFNGRFGFVREVNGQVQRLYLVDGIEFQKGEVAVRTSPSFRGEVKDVHRNRAGDKEDCFITSAELPEGKTLRGRTMLFICGDGGTRGYEIDRVERKDSNSLIYVTEDPGIEIEGETAKRLYFPQRETKGICTFMVPNVVCLERLEEGRYRLTTTSSAEVSLPTSSKERSYSHLFYVNAGGEEVLAESLEGDKRSIRGRVRVDLTDGGRTALILR